MKKWIIVCAVAAAVLTAAGIVLRSKFVWIDGFCRSDVKELYYIDMTRTRTGELNRCRELESFALYGADDSNLSALRTYDQLDRVLLCGFSQYSTGMTDFVSRQPKLTNLNMNSPVMDLSGIRSDSLEKVYLTGGELVHPEALADCPHLSTLYLENVTCGEQIVAGEETDGIMQDSTFLSGLDSVTHLKLQDIAVSDLTGITEMDALEMLSVSENCLSDENRKLLEDRGITVWTLKT